MKYPLIITKRNYYKHWESYLIVGANLRYICGGINSSDPTSGGKTASRGFLLVGSIDDRFEGEVGSERLTGWKMFIKKTIPANSV
uniref:Uncharacterized protein n=1 Tax=Brugia malayi TaxID=6279 RepID=A8PQT0_BRUMA